MKCFLEAIREQKLPTELLDVLDEAGIRYYEGEAAVATGTASRHSLSILLIVSFEQAA
jgi:hypothetical protein